MCWKTRDSALTPSPLGFSQVLILKVVKVLYFDTLLQVFILKVVRRRPLRLRLRQAGAGYRATATRTGGLAPLITSHSMNATSPKKAGWP